MLRIIWVLYGMASIGVILFLLNQLVDAGYDLVAPRIFLQDNWTVSVAGERFEDVNLETFRFDRLKKGDTLTIETILPDTLEYTAPAFCMPIRQTVVEFYVADELIYQYGQERFQNNKNVGNGMRFIHLDKNSAGKPIRIELTIAEDAPFVSFQKIWISDWQDAYRYVITENRVPFLLGTFLFVFGALMALLLVVAIAREFRYWDFLFVSLFSLCMGLWTLCYNDILVVFSLPPYKITLIQNMALLFAPLTIVGHMFVYVKQLEHRKTMLVYNILLVVQLLFTTTVIVLHAFDLLHTSESLKVQYLLFAFLAVFFGYLFLATARKNKEYKTFYYIGMLVVQVTVLYELITYALNRYAGMDFLKIKGISAYGIIAFVSVILLDLYRDISIRQIEEKERELLLKRAYTDELTQIHNRSYCSEYMHSLQAEHVEAYTIFSMDINNLKQTNDAYGHSAGDALIKCAAQMLEETFGKKGIIGRMGGDEFIVIIPSTNKELIEKSIEQFKQLVEKENSTKKEEKVSIAYGYAVSTEVKDGDVEEVYKLADDRMYQCKRTMKK